MKKNLTILSLLLFLLLPFKVGAEFPDQIINTDDLMGPYFIVNENAGAFVYFQNLNVITGKINAIELNIFLINAKDISSTTEFVIHPIINKEIDKNGIKIIIETKVGNYVDFKIPLEVFKKNNNDISDLGFVFYPVDSGEFTFHGGESWGGYNSEEKLLHLSLTYEEDPVENLISGYIKTNIKKSEDLEKAIEVYSSKNKAATDQVNNFFGIIKIIVAITIVIGGGYIVIKKINIKNIFKFGTKDNTVHNPKGPVYQVGKMFIDNSTKKGKEHIIKIEVKNFNKYVSMTSPDDSMVFVELCPVSYSMKVEFINQGDTNTIRNIELTINDRIVGNPVGFKSFKLEKADTRELNYQFSEKEKYLIDKGEYILNIVDAYDNTYTSKGIFPK